MTSQIQEALSRLHKTVNTEEVAALVEDIRRISQEHDLFSEADIGFVTSLLTSGNQSLVSFLQSFIGRDTLNEAKCKGLELLIDWFDQSQAQLQQCALAIKDVSFQIFCRDKFAKARCLGLVLLSKVLDACQATPVSQEFGVPALVDRLYLELGQTTSSLKPTVREEILCTLGLIAKGYPDAVLKYRDRLLSLYIGELNVEMTGATRRSHKNIIAGCLQGLSGFMYHYTVSFEEDADSCYKIFKCIRMAVTPNENLRRYDIPKAALILLSRHAAQFGVFLFEGHVPMYRNLAFWSKHYNRDMKQAGLVALEAFLREVSSSLVECSNKEDGMKIFEFFIQEFKKTMTSESNVRELTIALKGYGMFAAPCRYYLKESDIFYMLTDIINRSENVFQNIHVPGVLEDNLPLLMSFQEATGSILQCAQQVPAPQLASLEKLTVLQIQNFPFVPENLSFKYCKSLTFVLLFLQPLAPSSVSQILYQGVIRTCSHPIVADVEATDDDVAPGFADPRKITYKRYCTLWNYLLDAIHIKELNQLDVPLEARHKFVTAVYDNLVSAVTQIISKLNLSVVKKNELTEADNVGNLDADPVKGAQAACPYDFNIFINLIDFFRDIFTTKCLEQFSKWTYIMIRHFIELSTKHPLVSGFYKALTACLSVSEKISYFEKSVDESLSCLRLVSKFTREVLARFQQFRDDLLISCLDLVLHLPVEVVKADAKALVPAFRVALQQGLSYLPLARSAVKALKIWEKRLPSDLVLECFRSILPCLNPYLALGVRSEDNSELVASQPVARRRAGRKIALKVLYRKTEQRKKHEETELEALQLDILAFLGSLAGDKRSALLADLEQDASKAAIAWDSNTKEHLMFALPFVDVKAEIALDAFLPRVAELARFASRRQTKVASCELLHSLVLYMIGVGVQASENRRAKFPMDSLYRHLFPQLLHLACDPDQVTKNLFEPLLLQMMHWFSSRSTVGSKESLTIVECLWDTLTQPQETVLRDIAGRCFREFVQWSIKQSSVRQLERNPVNMKAVLKRLYSYSRHPNAYKRIGAALAFNSIYTIVREEETLVDVYVLEILFHFVNSLKLAHADEKSLGTQDLCCRALDTILRILTVKSGVLNAANNKRRWPGEKQVTLSTATEWLLRQTSCPQEACRRKCMELVLALIPRLPGATSYDAFIMNLGNGSYGNCLVEIFEQHIKVADVNFQTVPSVRQFCDRLIGVLECYTWLFQQKVLKPSNLFQDKKTPSVLFCFVTTFLEKLAVKKESDVLTDTYTPGEEVAFNYARCSVIVRLFNFLTAVLENYPNQYDCVPDTLWLCETFWNCAVLCVLDPVGVGFDLADLEVISKLPSEILSFLQQVSKVLPAAYQRYFRSSYDSFVKDHPEYHVSQFLTLPMDESKLAESNVLRLIGLTSGYRLLVESQLVPLNQNVGSSALNVVINILGRKSEPLPLEKELGFQLLELSAAFKVDARCVLSKVLDLQPKATNHFGHELSRYIVEHSDVSLPAVLSLLSSDDERNQNVVRVLGDVLTFVMLRKDLVSRHGASVVSALIAGWSKLKTCWADTGSQLLANTWALLLSRLLCLCSEVSVPQLTYVDQFVDVFVTLLRRSSAKLSDKVVAMEMLPLLAEDERPEISTKLREALEEMAAQHFPLECSDLLPGSLDFLCYTSALNKLVNAVETSGNPVLLDLSVRIIYREKNHFMEEEFLFALRRLAERSSEKMQTCLVQATYKLFIDNPNLPTHLRLAVAQKVLCMLLKRCSKSVLKAFFIENIADMVGTVAARLVSNSESQIVSKIGAFACMENMYSRFRKDDVMGQQSEVNTAFCKARKISAIAGNELTKEVTRYTSSAKKDDARGESKFLDLRLMLRCVAYNALVAIITCTQVEGNFYEVFLFQEKPEKGEYLWNNLIDPGMSYEFPLEREAPAKRKRQLVGTTESVSEGEGGRRQPRHVQATVLSGSSLAKDATQFSLSLSEQAFFRANKCDVDSSPPGVKDKVFERMKFVDLEDDELNNHPCMASVCYTLLHMADIGLMPKEVKVEDEVVPKWLTNVVNALVGSYMTKNALLFLVRVLVNSAEVLAPYSHHLIPPLLEVVASGCLGTKLNSFVVDVVVTILVWSSSYDSQELQQRCPDARPQPLLDFLVDHCVYERREVLRNTLELIRWFLELWKPMLIVPYEGVMRHLTQYTVDSKDTSGLSLLGMFLANDIMIFNQESRSDITRALSMLPRMLFAKYRLVYRVAAEVVGLALKKMNVAGLADGTFETDVMSKLQDLSREHEDQFVICLHEICKFYDPIADKFCDKLILMLPLALSTFKEAILEIIASCCGRTEDPVRKLISAGFLDFLDHGSDKTQRVSLEICATLVTQITVDQWCQILPIVCRSHSHSLSTCRNLVYNVCMLVYERFRLTSEGESLANQSKKVLILGLADAEAALRMLVGNFWSREEHLPKQTTERLVVLLKQTYLPESEENFLRSVCFLLLEMTSVSPDYSRKVFLHPLSDCQFVDYNVTGSWRQRHAAMTPLFAETLSTSQTMSQAQSDIISGRSLDVDQVRATAASLQFTPTQNFKDERSKGTFNWLTQSTLEMRSDEVGDPRPSLSSRLFTVSRSKSMEQESSAQKGPCWAKEIRYLRRRFVKDKEKVRQQYIRQEVRRKERRKELEKEQKARREAEVTLYRKYRLGELPDIEIPHSAIIAPLQALAEEDHQVAQMLLTAITESLLKDTQQKNSNMYRKLCVELQDSFLRVLDGSLDYSPSVVGFVLEVSFHYPADIGLRPDSLAWASVAGNHQNLGILLLEEMQIHSAAPLEREVKRRCKDQAVDPTDVSVWIKLVELYKSLDDSDAVRGIFECARDVSPGAREAFEKETLGDYQAAARLYEELYQRIRDTGPDEATFYDDAVLECCRNLCDWDGVEAVVTSRLQSTTLHLEDLFDFGYKQDHYVPSVVKSRIMTALTKGKNDRSFVDSICSAMDDPEKKRLLESNFLEELALMYAVEKDYSRSWYYAENLREQFLQQWSSLSVLNPSVLDRNLQSLQKIADLLDFLRYAMKGGCEGAARKVLNIWKQRLPSDSDTVPLWNDILIARSYFMGALCDITSDDFLLAKMELLNSFARATVSRNMIPVALRCVAEIEKLKKEAGGGSVSYVHTYCVTLERSCERLPVEKKVASHMKMLQKLGSCTDESDDHSEAATSALEGHLLTRLSEILYSSGSEAGLRLKPEQTTALKLPQDCSSPQQAAHELREKAFRKYQEAVQKSASNESSKQHSVSLLNMATFCNKVLQSWEDSDLDFKSRGECPNVMVHSVLSSMALGNTDAVDMFPQLLDVMQVHNSCRETFAAESVRVPCWMYLTWLNQILPMLNKEIGPYLFDIIDTISTHYPNALVYPFQVSYESYKFDSFPSNKCQSREFIERIKTRMDKLPLVNDFIAALKMLQFPDIAFKEWCQSMEDALRQKKRSQLLKQGFREMLSDLCGDGSVNVGTIRKHFSEAVKEKLLNAFGSSGEKLASMSISEFRTKCQEVVKGYNMSRPTSLNDVSPWLARFSMLEHPVGLEIPGQYSGKSKPMPEYHIHISGFDEKILVLSSKQKPCRITVRGDNEREYRFLVKTGEDLRQDDRIERLFELMNRAFTADPICRAKTLQLVTYKVVPLTTRVGLIEWLSNTAVLREFIQKGMDDKEVKTFGQMAADSGLNTPSEYIRAYEELKNRTTQLKSNFHKNVMSMNRRALYKAFLNLSSCSEAFFMLRSRFVVSHAAICIAHWVLGIGDRHLDNFLINMETGQEVGIDFGYAFGVATQFLPVPELMPFRLTPQYLNLVEPLRQHGGFSCSMQHVLRVLRDNRDTLLNVLDVFVKEPTVDWMRYTRLQNIQTGGNTESNATGADDGSEKWYPRQKVSTVRGKLGGQHPSYILRDEVRLRKLRCRNMEIVCLGTLDDKNRRGEIPESQELTVEEQVDCLIEQASDPLVLGLTWRGWMPWI